MCAGGTLHNLAKECKGIPTTLPTMAKNHDQKNASTQRYGQPNIQTTRYMTNLNAPSCVHEES